MSVNFSTRDDQLICTFSGRMDTTACMAIEADVNDTIDKHQGKVVFELKEVTYIASSFLRFCGRTVNSVGVDNFTLTNVSPDIKKVFKIAGIADRLNIS